MLLEGKTALITGASSGIGRAVAQAFAREGATVALCSRNLDGLTETLSLLSPAHARHRTYQLDVSDAEQIDAVVNAVNRDHEHIDILVSNAGVVTRASILELPDEEWDLIYSVNVRGPFLLTKAVGKHMVERGRGGSIVYVASTAGKACLERMAHYASSKAALIHFSRCAATEFGTHGIRVNTVCPGPTDTPFLAYPRPIPEAFIQRHHIPLGKIAQPEDVAQAVLFLASPAASHITGQALNVDGGEAML
jgi:NAD(P)-dependent dehydrogenase (short-subunit alcohol dehydrogenase family)